MITGLLAKASRFFNDLDAGQKEKDFSVIKPASFLSFDVEALPGRASSDHVDHLIWGRFNKGEFGIQHICSILNEHRLKGNFLIDMAACVLYGDKAVAAIGHFILEQGHELHVHLHAEWLVRQWGLKVDCSGPVGMDQLDASTSRAFIDFATFKYGQLFDLPPTVFRAGAFRFNEHTIEAARSCGYRAVSHFNSERHAPSWLTPASVENNDPFVWANGLLELPVDLSPEPLSSSWEVYQGYFDRVLDRKNVMTFNLVMHSWSLLGRTGEHFDHFVPLHEERLHRICEHLAANTNPMGYTEYLATHSNFPTVGDATCTVSPLTIRGNGPTCTICAATFGAPWENDICPGCGARARHRQLKNVFDRIGNPLADSIVLANYANSVEKTAFLTNAADLINFDIRPVGEVDMQMDIQDMSRISTESVDAFWAIHTLNHVKNDTRAVAEIHRVLLPGGIAIITIPYDKNVTTTECENLTQHYGEKALADYGVGTYRKYGLQCAIDMFSRFFSVQIETGLDPVAGSEMGIFLLKKKSESDVI